MCQLKQAQFGMPLHAITQYDPGVRALLGFAAVVAVEAVVPESPAAQAGLRAGDALLTIDGVPQPTLAEARAAVGVADRDLAQAALSRGGPGRARVLRILRDGVTRDVRMQPFSVGRDHGSAGERAKSVEIAAASLHRSGHCVFYPADFAQMLDSTRRPGCVKAPIEEDADPPATP